MLGDFKSSLVTCVQSILKPCRITYKATNSSVIHNLELPDFISFEATTNQGRRVCNCANIFLCAFYWAIDITQKKVCPVS